MFRRRDAKKEMTATTSEPAQALNGVHAEKHLPGWSLALAGAVLLWLSQPPFALSFLAWVALIPWILIAIRTQGSRRDNAIFFLVAMAYWGLTMQGIRHAHPAMYAALIAFAFYLACYSFAFVSLLRCVFRSSSSLAIWIAVPLIGTGLECIRNYLLTGVSAVMLGHTQANHESMIQIADAFGSYGITFLVLATNGAIYHLLFSDQATLSRRVLPLVFVSGLVGLNLLYGTWRLSQVNGSALSESAGVSVAILGRDEEIVFVQDSKREQEIFAAYVQQSVKAAEEVAKSGGKLDAIVWPESMYTGALPWLLIDPPTSSAQRIDPEFAAIIKENQVAFQDRGAQVQSLVRSITGQQDDPHLIVGCSVVRYNDPPQVHSGIVHLGARGQVIDWYGKTHLVMFGEYIPLIEYLPFLNRFIPPGMGVARGDGPRSMTVGEVGLVPNICIETAVERVAPQHISQLVHSNLSADAIVNVTNDGWFDRSSVVEHHLRCSQFVAVTCRRPVLISANGGPTAWIDGSGRIVQRLANDEEGAIIANFAIDNRWGLYQAIQDWPARMLAGYCIILLGKMCNDWLRRRRLASVAGG
jgi:apolipoprotein N-acyltransferase